jgi:hypothetical protein
MNRLHEMIVMIETATALRQESIREKLCLAGGMLIAFIELCADPTVARYFAKPGRIKGRRATHSI